MGLAHRIRGAPLVRVRVSIRGAPPSASKSAKAATLCISGCNPAPCASQVRQLSFDGGVNSVEISRDQRTATVAAGNQAHAPPPPPPTASLALLAPSIALPRPSFAARRHHDPDRSQVSFWDLGSYECEKRYTLPVSPGQTWTLVVVASTAPYHALAWRGALTLRRPASPY